MRYFLDTEFIESGPKKPIQLISIGIVAEDGRELYAISSEFNPEDANDWVKANVLSHLESTIDRYSLSNIGARVRAFVYGKPEFYGYYADYDWVVFCQIFGTMMDLPAGFPMYCRDLKQWHDQLIWRCGGHPIDLPKQESAEHNALHDARWNKTVYDFLYELEAT